MFIKLKPVVFFAAALFLVWYLLVDKFVGYPMWHDWDQSLATFQVASMSSIKEFGYPFWNVRLCGGYPGIAHPTNPFFSPLIILFSVFSTPVALRLWVMIFFGLGFWGMYRYLLSLKIEQIAVLFGSAVYVFGGMFSVSMWGEGMYQLLPYILLPHVLFFLDKYFDNQKKLSNIFSLVFWLVFMYFSGLHYIHVVFLCLFVLILLKWNVELKNKLLGMFFIFFLFVCLSAPKLLPMIYAVNKYPRPISDSMSGSGIVTLVSNLISRGEFYPNLVPHNKFLYGATYQIDENFSYVGMGVLLLSVLGLFIKNDDTKSIQMKILLFVFVWLSLGTMVFPSLYSILRHLPLMEMFRVAQRFRFVWIIPLIFFASYGFQFLLSQIPKKYKLKIGFVVIIVVVADLMTTNLLRIQAMGNTAASVRAEDIKHNNQTLVYSCTNNSYPQTFMYNAVSQNLGIGELACYDPLPVLKADVCNFQQKYNSFVTTIDGGEVNVGEILNNRIKVNGHFAKNSTVILNTTHDDGWQVFYDGKQNPSSRINISSNMEGYLGYTFLEEYTGAVVFRYIPRGFSLGVVIFAITIFGWMRVRMKERISPRD